MISTALLVLSLAAQTPAPGSAEAGELPRPLAGETLPPEAFGPAIIETMAEVMERAQPMPPGGTPLAAGRRGSPGTWVVPGRDSTYAPHSGQHYATNKWGDTVMAIGFGKGGAATAGLPVDLHGFWIAGQGGAGAWARNLVAVGFRNGQEVARSETLEVLSAEPRWFATPFRGIDRLELRAEAGPSGGAWYGLDDLTFLSAGAQSPTVIDFEDLPWRFTLTGSGHGGLTWERGTGDHLRQKIGVVHAPSRPPTPMGEPETGDVNAGGGQETLGGSATPPLLGNNFEGPKLGDAGAGWIPPDTCGTVGPNHFVSVVNMNLSVYERSSGARLVNTSLQTFFNTGGNAGDPRAVFDEHSDRYIIIACDFNSGIFFGFSLTDDPTGAWYKTFIALDQGSDAGNWPDYPTLGVDEEGIYTASYMVGGSYNMSLFAIDKAPLLATLPSLGTVTAWRQLPWEGAIQPAVTHGTGSGEYLASLRNNNRLRLRRIDGPMTAPTLTEVALVTIPSWGAPPAAPAQGSTSPLSALDGRLMNAEFRDGSLWATHSVLRSQRAAARWYEVDVASGTAVQVGTVEDGERYYYMPSIAVNAAGDVAMGFTASHASMYAGAWVTGRRANDPANQMAPPFSMKDGEDSYNYTDGTGTNRWGDYSLTSVDPLDDMGLWTVQEYARSGNLWANWIGELLFPCGDLGTNYCIANANSSGSPGSVAGSGSVSIADNDYHLLAWNLPASQPGIFYYGDTAGQFPLGDGYACAASGLTVRLPPQSTSIWGDVSRTLDFTAPPFPAGQILPGSTWYFQFWFRDPAGLGAGYSLTDGLAATFCP